MLEYLKDIFFIHKKITLKALRRKVIWSFSFLPIGAIVDIVIVEFFQTSIHLIWLVPLQIVLLAFIYVPVYSVRCPHCGEKWDYILNLGIAMRRMNNLLTVLASKKCIYCGWPIR